MAQCEEMKIERFREKGGRLAKRFVRICGLEAVAGGQYCPRHEFLHGVAEKQAAEKDVRNHVNRTVSHRGQGLPDRRAELIRRGYQYIGNKECAGCGARIEMWRTPNRRVAPYNPMPEEISHAV